jgi:hypothetical protein
LVSIAGVVASTLGLQSTGMAYPFARLHPPNQCRRPRAIVFIDQSLAVSHVAELLAKRVRNICFMRDDEIVCSGFRDFID